MKCLECHAKEPELYSEGGGAICCVEKNVLHVCCMLVIVTGTEVIQTEVVLCSWNLHREEKRDNGQVSSTDTAGGEILVSYPGEIWKSSLGNTCHP